MRKLSEIKNEDALDAIVDMIDPIIELSQDAEFRKLFREGDKKDAVKLAIKNHKGAVISIFAALDGEPIETYEINILQIPAKLLELFNDESITGFFQSQGLMDSDASFGSATESIEETEIK